MNKRNKIFLLAILWLSFYLLIIALDARYNFLPWGEIKLYEKLALEFLSGKIPFIDYHFEYPPASIIPFIAPRLFGQTQESYRIVYQFLNLLFTFLTLYLGAQIMYLINPKREKGIGIIQTILFFILIQLVLTRFDVFTMFLTGLGIFLYLAGEKQKRPIFQTVSYAVITLAGFVKLYPFLILPIFAIKEFRQRKYKLLIVNLILCLLTALPFIILMLIGWEGTKSFLSYHGERGLEIESTYSSILLLLNQIGILKDVRIIYSHASYGISGNLADICSKLSFPLFGITYAATLIMLAKQSWKDAVARKVIAASLLVILLFIITNKVFSPQYILWIFPLATIFAFIFKKKFKRLILALIFSSSILTILIYPVFWEIYNKSNLFLTLLLMIRNIFLIILASLSFSRMASRNYSK